MFAYLCGLIARDSYINDSALPREVYKSFLFTKKSKMLQKTYYKTKDYCKVKFSFEPGNAKKVDILGLNDDWKKPVKMKKKKDGSFGVSINLPKESRHEFKYLVDEKNWLNEPEADQQAMNIYGGTNSVLII